MVYGFDYSEEKDLILKATRGIGFEDVIEVLERGEILDDIRHPNKKKYPNQNIYILKIKDRVYAVPYVKDKIRKVTFLKTIYPSRMLKKKYIKQT